MAQSKKAYLCPLIWPPVTPCQEYSQDMLIYGDGYKAIQNDSHFIFLIWTCFILWIFTFKMSFQWNMGKSRFGSYLSLKHGEVQLWFLPVSGDLSVSRILLNPIKNQISNINVKFQRLEMYMRFIASISDYKVPSLWICQAHPSQISSSSGEHWLTSVSLAPPVQP